MTLLLVVVVVPLAVILFAWWLAASEAGTRTLASQLERYLPMVKLHGVEGRAAGPLKIAEIVIDTNTQRIVLSNVDVDWNPRALVDRHLHLHRLRAANLVIESKNVETPPSTLPQTLALPITIAIDAIELERATIPPVTLDQVGGKASYDGTRYRVDLAQGALRTSGTTPIEARLSGAATLGATRPFALDGAIDALTKANVEARTVGADGTVRVTGTLEEITMRADVTLREAKATAHADGTLVLRPYADNVLASIALKLQGIDLAAIDASLPHTRLDADVELAGLDTGDVRIVNRAPGAYDKNALPVRSLSARVDRRDGGWRIEQLVAALGGAKAGGNVGGNVGGSVSGNARYANGAVTLDLKLADVDLSKLDTRVRPTRLNGRAQIAHRGGTQEFTVALTEPVRQRQLSLNAHATLADKVLAIDRAELTMGRSVVSAKARVALSGTQAFSAEGSVRNFRPRDIGNFPQLPELLLNGDFAATGARSPAMSVETSFAIRDSQLAGHPLMGQGKVVLRGQALDVPQLTLQSGANKIDVRGALSALGERDSQLAFSIVAPALEQLGAGYKGRLEATGTARGTLRDPRVVVDWKAAMLSIPGGVSIDSGSGHVEATIDRRQPFSVADAVANASVSGLATSEGRAGNVDARVKYAASGTTLSALVDARNVVGAGRKLDTLRLAVDGTPARHAIDLAVSERDQRITARATGAVDDLMRPTRWQGTLERFDAAGTVDAKMAGNAAVSVSKTKLTIEHLQLQSNGAVLDLQRFERDGDRIASKGRIERLDVAKVLTLISAKPLPVDTDLVIDGQWDLSVGSTWDGTLTLDRRSGDVRVGARALAAGGDIALGLTTLHADARAVNGRLQVRLRAEGSKLGRIDIDANTAAPAGSGRFAIARDAPITGRAVIDVPSLAWIGPLASPNLTVAGQIKGDVALKGTIGDPSLEGRINGSGLRVSFAELGIDLRQGVLDSAFSGTRLMLERLEFASTNGGAVRVAGPIDFAGGAPTLDLTLGAKRYQLLNRADRKLVVSGESKVHVAERRLRITGEFGVDSGSFDIGRTGAPTLSDDVVIVGKSKKGEAPVAIALDVRVRLGEGISLSGRGLDAVLKGELRLLNAAGTPLQAQGTLNIDKGTFTAYGQKLAIEQGLLRFTGPLNNPQLSILAMRRDRTQEVEAGVSVRGTVLVPRITLVSEPNVADAEKLAWLVLGRSLASAGTTDMDALQKAAGLLLTNSAANGVSSQIATAFGLDMLSVGTSRDTVQQRIVTVGKRISSRLYVSYQKGLETASNALLLRYTLTPRLTVEAETGTRSVLSLFYNIAFD